jgi:hypothetical protein
MLDFRQGMSILRFKGLSADKQEETGRLGLGIQRGRYLSIVCSCEPPERFLRFGGRGPKKPPLTASVRAANANSHGLTVEAAEFIIAG